MFTEQLNEIGILMNVVAGILMAPDLIGKVRLRKFEQWFEENLSKMVKWIDALLAKYFPAQIVEENEKFLTGDPTTVGAIVAAGILSAGFWRILTYYGELSFGLTPFASIFLGIVAVLVALFILSFLAIVIQNVSDSDFFILAITLLIVLIGGVFLGVFYLITFLIPKLFERFLHLLVSRMKRGNRTVINSMLTIGVILFIAGNLLQFLASRSQRLRGEKPQISASKSDD